ncbi:UDP-N-acetylmuramoyl-tripeptide--D-alanyl-D-alanine ligase [Lysinibacillus sp. KU-BSD001]|uniref:UDP-N-acetylmuramoyl-tripeptide--D-alanyl-D- alanine ligase n=1 Tax=Lysinibacillus sp. KU-BSD001 TaxID=3141328 RepID=UPI0036E06C16
MQALQVKSIRQLLGGELLNGKENWYVQHAIYYKRHDLVATHTLLFVSKSDTIDWKDLDRKAPAVIISDKPATELAQALPQTTVIQVRSVLQAYWKFIHYYRQLFQLPVVAITGTCGKTTTKEMLKHVLSKDMRIQASISSKNEPRQSLPYLTGIDEHTEAAVFELGLGNNGNIKHQCMIYQPTIGLITNIGVHHLDGCKNLEGYIKAKAEMVEGIRPNGTLIINADDENIKKISLRTFKGKVVTFGMSQTADVRASHIQFAKDGMKFQVHTDDQSFQAYIPGYGEHQVYNALATIATIKELGLSVQKAILRLRTFQQMARHLEFSQGMSGSTIIDDTWTNNPTSIEAAIKVLHAIGKNKKVIVVLGDIKRLGHFEKEYHQEIGSLIAQYDIQMLITIGSRAEEIAKQALKEGTTAEVHAFKDVEGVLDILKPKLDAHTLLLIKGPMSSRSMIAFANQLKESP